MNHEAIDVYKSNLQMMAQIAEANDVRLVLVLQPIMGAGNKPLSDAEQAILEVLQNSGHLEHLLPIYPDMFVAAQDVGEEFNLPTFNYTHVFDNVEVTVYSDDIHLTATGNQIVARQLVDDLEPLLMELGCP
jgi:lysophospholipase L1-like esterase